MIHLPRVPFWALLFLLRSTTSLFAQGYGEKHFTGPELNAAAAFRNDVVVTTDGGTVMLGRGHDSLTCITKWDANGSPLWAKEFPIPVNQDFWGMVATTDGGVVIASGFGLQLFVSDILQGIDSIHAKYVVTKLDASGQSVWSRTIAIKEEDTPSDWLWFPQLVPCTDGGFILCVYARATVTSPFQRIIRMTADGYPIWSKEFRFSDLEQAGPIIHMSSDGADGCYIAGFVEVYSNRGFTAHIGSNGTLSWALKLGYTNPQQTLSCHDACSCANGDALVVGQMYNSGALMRFDNNGVLLWVRWISGLNLCRVHELDDGRIVCIGGFANNWSFGPSVLFDAQGAFIRADRVVDLSDGTFFHTTLWGRPDPHGARIVQCGGEEILDGMFGTVVDTAMIWNVPIDLTGACRMDTVIYQSISVPNTLVIPTVTGLMVDQPVIVSDTVLSITDHSLLQTVNDCITLAVAEWSTPHRPNAFVVSSGDILLLDGLSQGDISIHDATGRIFRTVPVQRSGPVDISTAGWPSGAYYAIGSVPSGASRTSIRIFVQ